MKRFLLITLTALGGLLTPLPLLAQGPAPYNRPTTNNPYAQPVFSPYLNLLRRGTNPAINYYGLVRPELEFRSNIQQLQQEVNTISGDVAAQESSQTLATGHDVMFGNLSHYFGGTGGRSAGGRGGISTVTPTIPTGSASGTRPQQHRGR